jgi:hypothetical protein
MPRGSINPVKKCLPAPRGAQIWIETAMLGAQSYAAVSVIAGAEFQAIGAALSVIDIGEVGGLSPVRSKHSGTRGSGGYGSRLGGADSNGRGCGSVRARQATAVKIATRAICGTRAAQCGKA